MSKQRKNRWNILAAVGLVLCLLPAAALAAGDKDLPALTFTHQGSGFSTVVTDQQGNPHRYDGVLDPETLQDDAKTIASYAVYQKNGDLLLETEVHPVETASHTLSAANTQTFNGYYSVDFQISEQEHTRAFLTGLSAKNQEAVQQELISAKLEHSAFSMEDLDFIDTEKADNPLDGDDYLCWAASAADMLRYTGWSAQAASELRARDDLNEDDLLDLFVRNFTDSGSLQSVAIDWFFNGTNMVQDIEDGGAKVIDQAAYKAGETGGYLKEYDSFSVMRDVDVSQSPQNITQMTAGLRTGDGVGVVLYWMGEGGQITGGHAITTWGYLYDTDELATNRDHYLALVVSDSDSDMQEDADRRTAPNKLNVLTMQAYDKYGYRTWYFDGYSADNGMIYGFTLLPQYSPDIPKETDPGASKNRFTTPNLSQNGPSVSNDAEDAYSIMNNFAVGDTVYVRPNLFNDGVVGLTEPVRFSVSIADRTTGKEVQTAEGTYSEPVEGFGLSDPTKLAPVTFSDLPVGRYKVTVTVNPDKAIQEAYYYDNTQSYEVNVMNKAAADGVKFAAAVEKVSYDKDVLEAYGVGAAQLSLDPTGLADFMAGLKTKDYLLMASYRIDDQWSSWSVVAGGEGEVPTEGTLPVAGTQVKLRLVVGGTMTPLYNFYSQPLDLSYTKLTLEADESHSGAYTDLAQGAAQLAGKEQIALRVVNASTDADGAPVACTVKVYGVQGEDKVLLHEAKGLTVAYGESRPIQFASWRTEKKLAGVYEIVAEAESQYGTATLSLGTLRVQEDPSLTVTTSQDVTDAYDGLTSLREAVAYLQTTNRKDPIVIDKATGGWLYLNSPILVTGSVTLQGKESTVLVGSGSTQLFQVEAGGSLTAERAIFHTALGATGGAIWNNGGTVDCTMCRFIYGKSYSKDGSGTRSGAGIYANGGTTTLRSCSLKNNKAYGSEGSAIALADGAQLQMLNCNVFDNKKGSGAISVGGGSHAVILYTSFTGSAGCALRTQTGGRADLFGCLAVNNGDTADVTGQQVNLYGCYVGGIGEGVTADAASVTDGKADQVYTLDEAGKVAWEGLDTKQLITYKAPVKPLVNQGIQLKNTEAGLSCSADGETWTPTNVTAPFSDAELSADVQGRKHTGLYGAQAAVILPFADVADGAWYQDAVAYVGEHGLMSGVSDTAFAPGQTTTRGMIVTILYRLEQSPAVAGAAAFADVAADKWYADAVTWAASQNIVNGVRANAFAPDQAITREQLAAILYRYAQYKEYDVTKQADVSTFQDSALVHGYAADALAWAYGSGLIGGVNDTTLAPQGNATRAQVAAMLTRFCQNVVE